MGDETFAVNCCTCRFYERPPTFYRCVICKDDGKPGDESPGWMRAVQKKTEEVA